MGITTRAELTIDSKSAVNLLQGLERNALNVSAQLDILAKAARRWERDLIGSQGRAGYSPWPRDLQATMDLKHSSKTMVETGALVDALLGTPRRTATMVKVVAPGYGFWHQIGTKHQPRRNIMGIPPQARLLPVIEELIAQMLNVAVTPVAVRES
jgi:hypothetical protein